MRLVLCLCALAALPAVGQVQITTGPEKIAVRIDGKPFTEFFVAGADVTKPYLHPLRAASGTYVTRMWPMENVAEEANDTKDHQHQRGVWFAHDSVNGLDFWNNEASYTTPNRGKIVVKPPVAARNGLNDGAIAATFEWQDLKGAPLLREDRVMTFYRDPVLRTIDFDITLTAIQKLTFGDSKDGTFGIRIRPVLQEDKGTGHILNADGLAAEKEAWGKPSNWCDYSGDVHGEKLGIAVFDNPANPRHPVRWHVRSYGLFAANEFGLSVFTNDKSQNGSVTVAPGQSLRYRYRIIVHPGDAKSADIAALWTKYASKQP
jgi:hypothetical protein